MRTTIGITTGDPAGIGPEIIFKTVGTFLSSARVVLFTDPAVFERTVQLFGAPFEYRWIADASEISDEPVVFLRDVGGHAPAIHWGEMNPNAGLRALAYLDAASHAALHGEIQAIVTAPVSKEAIGGSFVGQTDFLAERANASRYAMAFFAPGLKVVLATIHLSLRDALAKISTEGYINLIQLTDAELRRFGFKDRRIAVAAMNPHAGEGGMFGREDQDVLEPAVRSCAAEGIDVSGPHSADSLYLRATAGEFDVVIAPYHDQGLIPVKLLGRGQATNVTLGLPYVRTSPDHGTAFGIAGKGVADTTGMKTAMECALELVGRGVRVGG